MIATLATKDKLKAQQDKIRNLNQETSVEKVILKMMEHRFI